MPAPGGSRGRRAARLGLERSAELVRELLDRRQGGRLGACADPPGPPIRLADRRLPRTLRPAGGQGRGARASDRLQPARLARGHARRGPRPLSTRLDVRARPGRSRPQGLPDGRSRRRGHGGARRLLRPARGDPALEGGGVPRRRGRADLPAGLEAAPALHRALRRQADPTARDRDHPRRGAAGAGDPVQNRRQRPARRHARRSARQRRVGRRGSSTRSSPPSTTGPAARLGSSGRRTRRRA